MINKKIVFTLLVVGSAMFFCKSCSTIPALNTVPPLSNWQAEYARLLSAYVTPEGVRYRSWKENAADLEALRKVVYAIGRHQPGKDEKERLAFYCNAYNAWVLHRALEKYPTTGVLSGGDVLFFRRNRIFIEGKKTNLQALENEIIRKEFQEPRIHFAINCASGSCPPLFAKPFTVSDLEETFTRLTKRYVESNPDGVRVKGNTVQLSEIFKWFAEDFEAAGGVVSFINQYRSTPLPEDAEIEYMDYDWSLNEA